MRKNRAWMNIFCFSIKLPDTSISTTRARYIILELKRRCIQKKTVLKIHFNFLKFSDSKKILIRKIYAEPRWIIYDQSTSRNFSFSRELKEKKTKKSLQNYPKFEKKKEKKMRKNVYACNDNDK